MARRLLPKKRKRLSLGRKALALVLIAAVVGSISYTQFTPRAEATTSVTMLTTLSTARIILTTTGAGSWTVPDNWNSSDNSVEVIGGGGGGSGTNPRSGGGGGAYSKKSNLTLTPGGSVSYFIGAGGPEETAGGDTFFCNSTSNCASIAGSAVVVGAKGGGSTVSGGGAAGGAAASGVGDVKYSGGNGGTGHVDAAGGRGGGGGAAGPNGNGGNGGEGSTSGSGAGGGGGNGGGSNGQAGSGSTSGTGGNNYLGVGGGTSSVNPFDGGGGGKYGADGSAGVEWSTHGSGGGASGGTSGNDGGLYGAGGGGGTAGGSGAQGLIVITYTPSDSSSWTVPANWNSSNNSIEVIGAGGGGWSESTTDGGGGGGGGAYSKVSNVTLTPGAVIDIKVGAGGAAGSAGEDTYFGGTSCAASTVCAKGGAGASSATGGAGGSSASGVGDLKYSGGSGGNGNDSANSQGGGGGAAGPNGNGAAGGAGYTSCSGAAGGGGGGGNGGGSAGTIGGCFDGGAGGNNAGGTGGGAGGSGSAPTAGTDGGGGGGAYYNSNGANGGDGTEWTTEGSGGGGGGAGSDNNAGKTGGSGGLYGGGGGGGNTGGSGGQGLIVITYELPTTTLSDGTDPGDATLAPGGSATVAGAFKFQTSGGSASVSDVVVDLGTGGSDALSLVEITSADGSTVYGSVTDPATDTPTITASGLSATESLTEYEIRVTPKDQTDLDAVSESNFSVQARVTDWTDGNGHEGTDTAGATLTIDNTPPDAATNLHAEERNGNIVINWTTSASSDYAESVVLRWTGTAAGAGAPTDGMSYSAGGTISTATVVCAVSGSSSSPMSCSDAGLTNGTAYSYKVYQKDSSGNYDSGAGFGESMAWLDAAWTYRLTLTMDHIQIGSDLTDFPVYVDLSDLGAGFFSNVQADGGDIRITTSDAATEVPFELVSIDTSGQTGELYFKGSLSASTDTVFYLYYGNAEASAYAATDTYGRNNVWTNGYGGVWHMGSGTLVDSTGQVGDSSSNTGSAYASGKLGVATDFASASSQRAVIPNATSISGDVLDSLTYTLWANADTSWTRTLEKSDQYFLLGNVSGSGSQGPLLKINSTNQVASSGTLSTGAWYMVGGRFAYDGSATLDAIVNGAIVATTSLLSPDQIDAGTGSLYVGADDATGYFDGKVDELRISSVVRSDDWIAAEYGNQNSPATFYGVSEVGTTYSGVSFSPEVRNDVELRGGLKFRGGVRVRN